VDKSQHEEDQSHHLQHLEVGNDTETVVVYRVNIELLIVLILHRLLFHASSECAS
jgi:hypothetical protein